MKKLQIPFILVLLIFALNVISQSAEEPLLNKFEGTLKKIGCDWFLNTEDDFYKLSLAPDEHLSEKKIELQSKQNIVIRGIIDSKEIIVHSLILQGSEVKLRNEHGVPFWEESKKKVFYIVNPKKCIGCRLCIQYCPVDAIEMYQGVALIDTEKCTACGICVDGNGKKFKGCPINAISRVK